MVGITSLMDALLDRPMEAVISQLPLTADCKEALRSGNGDLGRLLRMAIQCEHGDWQELSSLAAEHGLAEDRVWDAYDEACRWSCEILLENNRKD